MNRALDPQQRRHVLREAAIGAAITAVLSLGFVVAMFGTSGAVPVFGMPGLIADAVPQNFFGALMCMVVPSLITRKRVRAGLVAPADALPLLPRSIGLRALALAVLATVVGTTIAALSLAWVASPIPIAQVMIAKSAYGAALGAVVGALAARAALGDEVRS